jgi:hypothetical protein
VNTHRANENEEKVKSTPQLCSGSSFPPPSSSEAHVQSNSLRLFFPSAPLMDLTCPHADNDHIEANRPNSFLQPGKSHQSDSGCSIAMQLALLMGQGEQDKVLRR